MRLDEHADGPLAALPEGFVELRRRQIEAHGPMATDALIARSACTRCGEPMADFELGMNAACGFNSVQELLAAAPKLAAGMGEREKPVPCRVCGGPTRVASVQYHAFHGGFGEDLVVHWRPGEGPGEGPSIELLRWSPSGGASPAGTLTVDEEARFIHEAALREAKASFELGEVQRGVDLVADLYEASPAEPLLLRFVPELMEGRYTALALAIAGTHRDVAPDDAEGHYWYGEVLLRRIDEGLEPRARLPEAQAALKEAGRAARGG